MNKIFSQKLWFIMLEQFFMKYVWSSAGMIMVSLPILSTGSDKVLDTENNNLSARTQYLTTARTLLLSAADAIERLMTSYKEILALAGHTNRVAGMIEVFEETAQGVYSKSSVIDTNRLNEIVELINGKPKSHGKIVYSDKNDNFGISLKNVPVITPNGDVVIRSLSLSVHPGMNVIITGPNGCGKSSLFRIICGLWPVYAGELRIPQPMEGKRNIFYIPQRPYMSIGSLCDQIIYPDCHEDMINKGIGEVDLLTILNMVKLEYIAQR